VYERLAREAEEAARKAEEERLAREAAEAARKAEEARLAAEQARKDAEERARRAIRTAPKPVQLGLKDLKAALEARAGGK
jgi:colicin import membrane protein